MLAKISSKNQLTLPKNIVTQLGLGKEKYVDLQLEGHSVILKPVDLNVEERIPEDQLKRFEEWALDHSEDKEFSDSVSATQFLKKRLKKK